VLADDHLLAAPDVWVAGDIAEYQSVIHGRRIRIEHWDVALNQGRYVGRSWAGAENGPYTVVPYFFSDLADWASLEYVGGAAEWDQEEVRGSPEEGSFSVWYRDRGRVRAVLDVNGYGDIDAGREALL
jgi:3-phenylpropionate/trans-cinnamate dioxygenase ferredoxin reductase component